MQHPKEKKATINYLKLAERYRKHFKSVKKTKESKNNN